MLNTCDEMILAQQSSCNLRFLIELHLQKLASNQDDGPDAQRARTALRRLMDTEESLRAAPVISSPPTCVAAMA